VEMSFLLANCIDIELVIMLQLVVSGKTTFQQLMA